MHLVEQVESREALGGSVTLGLVHADTQQLPAIFAALWRAVFTFEKQFSRFIPESELSRLNSQAGIKIPVSDNFRAILQAAQELAVSTNGLYNPFVLPAIQRAGYAASAIPRYTHEPTPDYTERRVVSADKLELGDTWARIPYGTAIDLGGCGKGYLADRLGDIARAHGVAGYWLELSGDIATYGLDGAGQPITIAVQNASSEQTARIITCPPEPFGIATSGTFRRTTQTSTVREHHIIDPATGKPAKTDVALATVCAPSAVAADVLASCAVIRGSAKAPRYLADHGATSWLLQIHTPTGINTVAHGPYIQAEHETAHA